MMTLKREVESILESSFKLFSVVLITGARQIGKSILLEQLLEKGIIKKIITFDDLSILNSAKEDPVAFIENLETPVAMDEIQRCPELMLAIKERIDRERKKSLFILTGSSNILANPKIRESLAGRMDIIQMEGLSAREISQKSNFPLFSDIFTNASPPAKFEFLKSQLSKDSQSGELEKNIYYGSYPEVRLSESQIFRKRWFSAYETTYIEKDIRDFKVDDILGFNKLFRYISQRSASLVNYNQIGNAIGLDQRTVKRYIELLELTFQATILEPFHSNLGKRLIKTPKIYMNDTGHVSFAQNVELENLKAHENYGYFLENWVFSELRKILKTSNQAIKIYFYRSHTGIEVDFIVENGMQILAIECKGKSTLQKKDLKGLEIFLNDHPEGQGIIFYSGKEILPYGPRILAIPLQIFL